MIYLDYQATTPLAPEAREAMLPWLGPEAGGAFANPHSPHAMGRKAAAAIEIAREQVCGTLLGGAAEPGRLFFTSGATEAANWALKGTLARAPSGRRRIVTVATEHACVLDTARALQAQGAELVVLPVGDDGLVDLDRASEAIDATTALVAVMAVNNEIGVIQDIPWFGERARAVGATMFCDAVQGFGRTDVPVASCDLVAISAHKIYGPKGVGALWVRNGFSPEPLLHGGGQEGGLRSGTLSPALCAGFGAAAALGGDAREAERAHVDALFDDALKTLGSRWSLNGSPNARWKGNLNIRRDRLDAARLISELRGIAFSVGSACASGSGWPSHVLHALGLTDAEARSSIRLGFGRYTTAEELASTIATIDEAADRQSSLAA